MFSHVVMCVICHRGLSPETDAMKNELLQLGAGLVQTTNSDLCLARNVVLTEALHRYDQGRAQVALLIDDDNSARAVDVHRLCAWPREDLDNAPLRAAVYPTTAAKMSACKLVGAYGEAHVSAADEIGPERPYTAGLGLTAVRLNALSRVAQKVPKFYRNGSRYYEFSTARSVDGAWVPDDESICRLFGGAVIDHTIECFHHKPVALSADQETLDRIRKGEL